VGQILITDPRRRIGCRNLRSLGALDVIDDSHNGRYGLVAFDEIRGHPFLHNWEYLRNAEAPELSANMALPKREPVPDQSEVVELERRGSEGPSNEATSTSSIQDTDGSAKFREPGQVKEDERIVHWGVMEKKHNNLFGTQKTRIFLLIQNPQNKHARLAWLEDNEPYKHIGEVSIDHALQLEFDKRSNNQVLVMTHPVKVVGQRRLEAVADTQNAKSQAAKIWKEKVELAKSEFKYRNEDNSGGLHLRNVYRPATWHAAVTHSYTLM